MDAFAAARLLAGTGSLAAAATMDVRTRRVRDPLWIALGTLGLGILGVEIATGCWVLGAWLLFGSAAILFYAVFYGKPILDEDGVHLRPLRMLALAAAAGAFFAGVLLPMPSGAALLSCGSGIPLVPLASVPVLILVYQGLYQIGLIHGGADAKALIALTLLVPTYPDASPFPLLALDPRVQTTLENLFPFSLSVFVNAAILFLVVPLAYLLWNAAKRDLAFPQALLGTRVALDPPPRHAWLMERITDHGEHVLVLFPKRGRDQAAEAEKLRDRGIKRAWVQPQVPFLVPLLAGFVLAFFVGNLLLGLLTALLPAP